jgi:hypothetical protein
MTKKDIRKLHDILELIKDSEEYKEGILWGKPRPGHPESTIAAHIEELEDNLKKLIFLVPSLTNEEVLQLTILVHVHDTFKGKAKRGAAINDPESHASLATDFLKTFTDNEKDLFQICQWHDEPYAIYKKYKYGKNHKERLEKLILKINNWKLFLIFQLIDNCTAGKKTESVEWFFKTLRSHSNSKVYKALAALDKDKIYEIFMG